MLVQVCSLCSSQPYELKMPEPSRVLHLRYVAPEVTEDDILKLIRPFGAVQRMVMLEKNRALLEMEDVDAAGNVIRHYSNVAAKIKGEDAYLQFSLHQQLREPSSELSAHRRFHRYPSRVLWMTIHNSRYPVPIEVFHELFSHFGCVEKIIIFQTVTGPQTLLQFLSEESAIRARNTLHGRDVYDGCCTLDIKFSDCQELHVSFNSDQMWDYTVMHTDERQLSIQQGLEYYVCIPVSKGLETMSLPPVPGEGGEPLTLYPDSECFRNVISYGSSAGTLLVNGLNPVQMDADRIFNLFSNYGDVLRIKVLDTRPDVALVQMENADHAEMAVGFLDGVSLFGKRMQVMYSEHTDVSSLHSAREFQSSNRSRFHRYSTRDFNYRHCCAPTPMLHVSRLAPEVDNNDIISHLAEHGTIIKSRLFELNGKRQALILFEAVEQCTEALVCKHGTMLKARAICLSFSKQTTA